MLTMDTTDMDALMDIEAIIMDIVTVTLILMVDTEATTMESKIIESLPMEDKFGIS